MYTLLECLTIAGIVLVLGGVLFIAASLFVLVQAGVRWVATLSRRLATRESAVLREKLESSPLAQAVAPGD